MNEREADDPALVQRAQAGDHEAFAQLVRLHRSRMLGWAKRIVKSEAGAEDVVQDALVAVLKRIDRLADPEKLVPWLRTIVRNQALMSVRGLKHTAEIPAGGGMEAMLAPSRTASFQRDPETLAIARLALEQAQSLFSRLGDKERAVLLAHCLEGLTVQEVADKLGMKSGAVYTAISRSRAKLTEASFEAEVDILLRARRKWGRPTGVSLDTGRYYKLTRTHNSMAAVMMTTLTITGRKDVSISRLMGITGHAFRIQISDALGISSPFAYDWTDAVLAGWRHLGYTVVTYGGPGVYLNQPDELTAAMETIFDALERGIPVMAWHVSNPEFGLISGFDDKAKAWIVTDTSVSGKRLPYARLGRSKAHEEWFVAVPSAKTSSFDNVGIKELFNRAVRHYKEEPAGLSSFIYGHAAYQSWIDALARRTAAHPLAAAYNAAVTAEARTFAAQFLLELQVHESLLRAKPSTKAAVGQAQRLYEQIAAAWRRIAEVFPLPHSADPSAPGRAGRAIQLLEQVSGLEREAAAALEEAAYWMRQ